MISLKDNRTALVNLGSTLVAIDDITKLIDIYSENKPGPAYIRCVHEGNLDIQIDRTIMVTTLEAQRTRLVSYLATLGIDANS